MGKSKFNIKSGEFPYEFAVPPDPAKNRSVLTDAGRGGWRLNTACMMGMRRLVLYPDRNEPSMTEQMP